MNKLILAAPAVLALAACGTTALPAHTVSLTETVHPPSCQAYMSNTLPADETTTVVHVRTQASVKVFTVAFYRTVNRAYFVRSSTGGRAAVPYQVGEALPGHEVKVTVTVVRGNSAGTCSTSFTPRNPGSPSQSPSPSPTATSTSPAPRPSSSSPAPGPSQPAACYPKTSGGNCYNAGEYCPDADHGDDGVSANGRAIVCEDDNGWRWEYA